MEQEAIEHCKQGHVEEAMSLVNQAEALKRELTHIETRAVQVAREAASRKHMMVCDVSGNFMNSTDNGERLRSHFDGKQYMGWKMIRDKLAELKAQDPPPPSGDWRRRDRERGERGDGDRRRRSSSRDRDRRDRRDRDRDGDRRRDYDRRRVDDRRYDDRRDR